MNAFNSASLINLLGFTVGVALYALLFVMVVKHRRQNGRFSFDRLLFTTAVLGFLWNIGELLDSIYRDFSGFSSSPLLQALSYSALGFLPSVVVYSAWKNSESNNNNIRWLAYFSYLLSAFASFLHFYSAIYFNDAPSEFGLRILTFGALGLLCGLLIFTFRQTIEKKAIWISALLIFAVSALHLSSKSEENSWIIELIAHQSSVPLAIAILMQDFRFAFADLFLKRAISLLFLALLAFGLYVYAAVPLLVWHETHDRNDVQAAIVVLTLWMATALIYPTLYKFAVWLVDKIILQRENYEKLQRNIAEIIEIRNDKSAVLDEICRQLKVALTAKETVWHRVNENEGLLPVYNFSDGKAELFIPTTESPFFQINLSGFTGGRKLLSDEQQMLEKIALLAARRIDNLRVTEERHEKEMQAKEISKLAAESQLKALRAQINPHFLFNALTTIGYLIQTSPDKAFTTLMKLTRLLRGILSSNAEFTTLGEEIKLIENYLEIEKTRFEERLKIEINIPKELEKLRIPSLILQPLVENAIKHGISELKNGGSVEISAKLETKENKSFMVLSVTDTGAGVNFDDLTESRKNGLGLNNVEQRLLSYYGEEGSLTIKSKKGKGTSAEIFLPLDSKLNIRKL